MSAPWLVRTIPGTRYACPVCVAVQGLTGRQLASLPLERAAVEAHIRASHGAEDPVIKRLSKRHPEVHWRLPLGVSGIQLFYLDPP